MSGSRLIVGVAMMGILLPITLFLLLGLATFNQLFTIAACTFVAWGLGDLLAGVLERPRLDGRSPTKAMQEDWDRRKGD